ncbi:MAG: hypothetical protein AVDCRST_MAG33-2201, partial [uncultured Thermomicrobiales bacterium]
ANPARRSRPSRDPSPSHGPHG